MGPIELAAGVLLIAVTAAGTALLIIVFGAAAETGRQLGRATLAESAPWIARIVPRLAVTLVLIGSSTDVQAWLMAEIDSIVHKRFANAHGVSQRTRALVRTLAHSASLILHAGSVRRESLSMDGRRSLKPLASLYGAHSDSAGFGTTPHFTKGFIRRRRRNAKLRERARHRRQSS